MLEQRIQQQFFDAVDLKYQSSEGLVKPVAEASQAIVGALTAGGKVLVCGIGPSAALASLCAAQLMGRFERERPGLAVLALGADAVVANQLALSDGSHAMLARQVATLGAPGDLLLVLDPEGEHEALLAAVDAAHANDMAVIALLGRTGGALRAALGETDAAITVPHDRSARVLEMHLLILHCLCDAIDLQLLGEQDPA
ncbi:MAG: SIS domain-containing protein [Burkholderiaceae bacterium]|jgi:D-sedoheptulose 7-phosphate isomerase|nr:SIS domain-containing protein [Burkholderiaceae bacterium]